LLWREVREVREVKMKRRRKKERRKKIIAWNRTKLKAQPGMMATNPFQGDLERIAPRGRLWFCP
jgi:hypothetical protein